MVAIETDAIITGAASCADGSLSLRVKTPELTAEQKTAFFELCQKNVRLFVKPMDTVTGLKEIRGEFGGKTPSLRMRNVLFCLWKHLGDTNRCEISFDTFYQREMEKIISSVKDQLPGEPAF